MRTAPCASVTVVIIGRNSGVRPTASATANRSDSSGSRCSAALTRKTKSTRKMTVRMMRKPNCRVPRSNSVSGGRAARRAAMSPNGGARPVATTSAVAVPLTTDVPEEAPRCRRRAGCGAAGVAGAASFSAGSDSPVSAACCTWRSRASSSRASAGTRSPAASRITSPGTSSRRGLAPGDVIRLAAGDPQPADARLLEIATSTCRRRR